MSSPSGGDGAETRLLNNLDDFIVIAEFEEVQGPTVSIIGTMCVCVFVAVQCDCGPNWNTWQKDIFHLVHFVFIFLFYLHALSPLSTAVLAFTLCVS